MKKWVIKIKGKGVPSFRVNGHELTPLFKTKKDAIKFCGNIKDGHKIIIERFNILLI